MSEFQDDEHGNDNTGLAKAVEDEGIPCFVDDVVAEIEGIMAGMGEEQQEAKPGDAMLDSHQGSVAFTMLEYWRTCLENCEDMLETKTTVGELLLFLATKQADLELVRQGDKVQ